MERKFTFIELFAGAGGLSEGLIRAGFYPVAFIEKDKNTSLTLKTRLAYHFLKDSGEYNLYRNYISGNINRDVYYNQIPEKIINSVINEEINEDNLKSIFRKVKQQMSMLDVKKIDLIAGGPPCQSYSLIGRARNAYNMKNDKRNYLFKFYVQFLKEFGPEMFIFENVPGITSAENGKLWADIKSHFLKSGYSMDFRLLNAYDFGVLQNRKRIIIIGWKSEYDLRFPEFEKDKNVEKYRIKDLFSDLPSLRAGDKLYTGKYTSNPSGYISEYGIRKDDDILTLHLTRSVNERDGRIYRFYIESWLKERRRPEYDELPDELKTHKNRKIFRDRFKVIAPDLPYSQTITAHLEKDGHYYIHYDINQLRSISVREAARIQSFPDNYYFEGPMTSMFRQIGNAVPPIMAEKIAVELRKMMVMI